MASAAVFNQIRTVDRTRLTKKLGAVSALVSAQVDEAIKAAFGLSSSDSPPTITDATSEGTGDIERGRYKA